MKIKKSTYLIYGMGVSYFMLDQFYTQWISFFYLPPETETTLVPLLSRNLLALAFIVGRLIDAIADPIVGYLSDKSNSKYGRRSIFMMIGGIPLGLLMIAFFYPPTGSQMQTFIYLTMVCALFFIFYTFVGGPYNSLVADLSETKEEQINFSTIQALFRLIFTAIAMILPGIMIKRLGNGNYAQGIRYTVIILTFFSVLGIYFCTTFLKEKEITTNLVRHEPSKFNDVLKLLKDKNIILYFLGYFCFFSGFNILRGLINYYISLVMNIDDPVYNTYISIILFGIAGVMFPLTNIFVKKYNYKKILILDIIIIMFATLGLLFFGNFSFYIGNFQFYIAYLMFALCGIGISGAAFIFPPAMISSIAIHLREEKKVSVEGVLFGIQGLFLKLALLIQQVASVLLLTIGSKTSINGLKSGTKLGVQLTIITALIFFTLSLKFYILREEKE